MEAILTELTQINEKFGELKEDVDKLKSAARERSRSRSPIGICRGDGEETETSLASRRRSTDSWADRDPSEKIDYSADIGFLDSDEEENAGSLVGVQKDKKTTVSLVHTECE